MKNMIFFNNNKRLTVKGERRTGFLPFPFSVLLIAMAITFAGCERNGEVILMGAFENGKITFFATARQLIIDWGDGSPLETYNDVNETIEHTHADNTTVQIKIMEKGLTTLKTKQLTSLYVNGCTALEYLDCEDDYQLISLIVSGCTALHELNCYNNQLTSLDVSSCTALHELSCYNNQLTSLNVSGCMALAYLDCDDNQLTTAALNTVFTALPDRATGFYSSIYIYNNPGTGTCNRAIAENKGWSVSYH